MVFDSDNVCYKEIENFAVLGFMMSQKTRLYLNNNSHLTLDVTFFAQLGFSVYT